MFMKNKIYLTKMTRAVAETYFPEFVFDPAVFLDGQTVNVFRYSDRWLDSYLMRHHADEHLAIMLCDKPIGELLFKRIDHSNQTAVLSIHLQNDSVKNKGYGTEAERIAIDYGFNVLHLKTLYAEVNKKNRRSVHVLEKVGFQLIKEDAFYYYYEIRANQRAGHKGI